LQRGLLDKYGVELIGAKLPSIDRAEDRELFKQSMKRIGLSVSSSGSMCTATAKSCSVVLDALCFCGTTIDHHTQASGSVCCTIGMMHDASNTVVMKDAQPTSPHHFTMKSDGGHSTKLLVMLHMTT
jgi:hypothetical protein